MYERYHIRVTCDNPEFEEQVLRDGFEADGFLLLAIKDGKPFVGSVSGMTMMDITRFFIKDDSMGNMLQQAAVVSEGFRKGQEIDRQFKERERERKMARTYEKEQTAAKFREMLRNIPREKPED